MQFWNFGTLVEIIQEQVRVFFFLGGVAYTYIHICVCVCVCPHLCLRSLHAVTHLEFNAEMLQGGNFNFCYVAQRSYRRLVEPLGDA